VGGAFDRLPPEIQADARRDPCVATLRLAFASQGRTRALEPLDYLLLFGDRGELSPELQHLQDLADEPVSRVASSSPGISSIRAVSSRENTRP
jgi:hypothetical protein